MTRSIANESFRSQRFINLISISGLGVLLWALYNTLAGGVELQWVLLCLVTALVVSKTDIQLPKISSTVTLDDTFIYISFLLHGQWPSVVLAGVTGAACSLHYSNRRKVIPFNAAVMSLSFFLSSSVIELVFGSQSQLIDSPATLILATQCLALIHYVLNSGLVSIVSALRKGGSFLGTWRESFLWTSISYFAGAFAACLVVKLIHIISFYAFIIAIPILIVTYLTYRNYLDRIRVSLTHGD